MARKGRKIGLRRIDAAVDALTPFGFPKPVIRKTVNSLLKVYGGDNGWRFIEEASYQLVIDTILEQQQEEEAKQEEEVLPEEGTDEKEAGTLDACASSSQVGWAGETNISCKPVEEEKEEEHVPAARAFEMCQENIADDGQHRTGHVIGDNTSWEYYSRIPMYTGNLAESTITGSEGLCSEASHNMAREVVGQNSESYGFRPSHLHNANDHVHPKRKPCYGWISDDEDDETEVYCGINLRRKLDPAESLNTMWCKGNVKVEWEM